MAVTWLYATLFISICSFCREHADANIWSFLLFFRFFWGCQKSALIATLSPPLRLLLVASLLILGYDATASSNIYVRVSVCLCVVTDWAADDACLWLSMYIHVCASVCVCVCVCSGRVVG